MVKTILIIESQFLNMFFNVLCDEMGSVHKALCCVPKCDGSLEESTAV